MMRESQSSAVAILNKLSTVGMSELYSCMVSPDTGRILDGNAADLLLDSMAFKKDAKSGLYSCSQGDIISDTYLVLSNNSKNGIKIIPIMWLCLNFQHAPGQGTEISSLENVKKLVELERTYQLEQEKVKKTLQSASEKKREIENKKAEIYTRIMTMGGFDIASFRLLEQHKELMAEYHSL